MFIVSDFGGESVDEILAITESLPGYPAPSREAGKGTAGDAGAGFTASSFGGYEQGCGTLRSQGGDLGGGSETLAVNAAFSDGSQTSSSLTTRCHDQFMPDKGNFCAVIQNKNTSVVSWNGDTTPKASEDVSVTLRSQQGGAAQCKEHYGAVIQEAKAFTASDRSNKAAWEGDISGTINCQMNSESSNLQMGVRENLTVRRLTPIECERLQGFPDNWTSEKMELTLEGNEWKATGKVVKQADGPRYKAMGNAVTVNVAEWIGKQIGKVLDK